MTKKEPSETSKLRRHESSWGFIESITLMPCSYTLSHSFLDQRFHAPPECVPIAQFAQPTTL